MTNDTGDQQPRESVPTVSRRNYLRVAGVAAGAGLLPSVASAAPDGLVENTDGDREDFLWVPGYLMEDPPEKIQYDNLLAYARRHDLTAVITISRTIPETADRLEPLLQKATEYGVQCWFAGGCFRDDHNAPQLVNDSRARETFLNRLQLITEVYADYYPEGKVVVWHEAPLVSNWDPNGGWTYTAVRNMRDLGPEIFAWQMKTIKSVSDDIDVATFLHFPYVEPGGNFGNIFSEIMADLTDLNALPDFTFTDFYRGYREPTVRQEGANAFLRRMMRNATEETNGQPVYNLAEDHTINNGYTPSKESIRMNLQAAFESGADGVGWYFRNNYRQTDDSLTPNDPFLPNVGGVTSEPNTTTLTFSRDRFQYAYDQTFASREGFNRNSVFNLWIHGYDMDKFEHRLWLKTADDWEPEDDRGSEDEEDSEDHEEPKDNDPDKEDEWVFIGDFNGYTDQEYVYSGNDTEHVSIFHALDRDRFLGEENTIEAKIQTDADSDGSELYAMYAVPFDANEYFSEPNAPDLLEQSAVAFLQSNQGADGFSLASATPNTTVSADETTRLTLSKDKEEDDED